MIESGIAGIRGVVLLKRPVSIYVLFVPIIIVIMLTHSVVCLSMDSY